MTFQTTTAPACVLAVFLAIICLTAPSSATAATTPQTTDVAATAPDHQIGDEQIIARKEIHGRTVTQTTHVDAGVAPSQDPLVRNAARRAMTDMSVNTPAYDKPRDWCGTPSATPFVGDGNVNQPVIRLVYAYPADAQNRFQLFAPVLQNTAHLMEKTMALASGDTKTIRFAYGTDCGPEYIDILSVPLSHNTAYYNSGNTFSKVVSEIEPILNATPGVDNAAVFADGTSVNGILGQSGNWVDDRPSSAVNASSQGGVVSVIYGSQSVQLPSGTVAFQPFLFLHEIVHALGAVNLSAPHSTGAYHCNDGADLMCYVDGGPKGQASNMTYNCFPANWGGSLDCNHDDYFNPSPAPGSYLDTHWNIYNSLFLGDCSNIGAVEQSDRCGDVDYTPPNIVIRNPEGGQQIQQGATVTPDYTCKDDVDGSGAASGIDTCDDDGVDTSTVGLHYLTVTASDNAGNTSQVNQGYFVVAPPTTTTETQPTTPTQTQPTTPTQTQPTTPTQTQPTTPTQTQPTTTTNIKPPPTNKTITNGRWKTITTHIPYLRLQSRTSPGTRAGYVLVKYNITWKSKKKVSLKLCAATSKTTCLTIKLVKKGNASSAAATPSIQVPDAKSVIVKVSGNNKTVSKSLSVGHK